MLNKKILFVFVMIGLALLVSVGICAENMVDYQVAETDLLVSLPEDWVFTDRTITDDNPACIGMQMNATEYKKEYLHDNKYAIAYDLVGNAVLYIDIYDSSIEGQVDDEKLREILDARVQWLKEYGDIVKSSSLFQGNVSFYKTVSVDKYNYVYCHYESYYGGKRYVFEFVIPEKDFSEQKENSVYDIIVKDIEFGKTSGNSGLIRKEKADNSIEMIDKEYGYDEEIEEASSFTVTERFHDTETDVSFIIPDGWIDFPNTNGNESIKTQYTPADSVGQTSWGFAVFDLYSVSGMSESGLSRNEIDFSYLDDTLLTSMLGPLEVKSKIAKQYGDFRYKVVTCPLTITKYGLTATFDCEMACTIINGYVVMFQYMSMKDFDKYHSVFETVLKSVSIGEKMKSYQTEYGVKFGMTPQEVQDIEIQNKGVLKGTYESSDSYQLYYETDVKLYSMSCIRMEYDFDLENRLLYQILYASDGASKDYEYLKNQISKIYGLPVEDETDSGDYSVWYDVIGRGDNLAEASHWVDPERNVGIDLWHYTDYDTVFAIFYDTTNPASYGKQVRYYTDELGISFMYMEDWDVTPLSLPPMMIGFTNRRDIQSSVQYIRMDLWENLKEYYEPMGFKREDFGPDFLEDSVVSAIMDPYVLKNLKTKEYNGVRFRVFDYLIDDYVTTENNYNVTVAMTMKSGYLHMFQFSSASQHDQLLPDFEKLMNTVTFTN